MESFSLNLVIGLRLGLTEMENIKVDLRISVIKPKHGTWLIQV